MIAVERAAKALGIEINILEARAGSLEQTVRVAQDRKASALLLLGSHARGRDLRARPLEARRAVLERVVEGSGSVLPVRRLASNGQRAWKEVLARGLEGYVAKDPTSTYLVGGPTRAWLKAKVRREGRFVVGGLVERSEGWSLLLGSVQDGRLLYRGLVHFGVGQRLADALKGNGLVRSTSPFTERIPERGVIWLEPKLVVEVGYAEVMHGGALRAALFRGFV